MPRAASDVSTESPCVDTGAAAFAASICCRMRGFLKGVAAFLPLLLPLLPLLSVLLVDDQGRFLSGERIVASREEELLLLLLLLSTLL